MAGIRAVWKGFLSFGELSCPVALYTGASTAERISFHTLNRATGHRVRREFIDPVTNKPVERDDQVKGFEVGDGRYVLIEPDEVAKIMPVSDKKLDVTAFVPCGDIDTVYFDKPYYLAPAEKIAAEPFAVIREALRESQAAAVAQAVLFRRHRTVMIRAQGQGLVAHTLNYDYEVRSSDTAFSDLPKLKLKGEMLDLAKHIINTKRGEFDPAAFDDRYEAALAELVRAKQEGRTLKARKPPAPSKVVDLMEALRASAGQAAAAAEAKPSKRKKASAPAAEAPRRKAG
ncbi:Ku protein [Bosea sp. Leaf344]|uniref:non-homologous end joining protein Ku n=1 Tax=Bosea sp. Leaf344 TaxID=1736346 RepID=UPI0009E99CD0|nr:Ku protein [Bosea sp. Leaf344]